jgi:hypothetical protein
MAAPRKRSELLPHVEMTLLPLCTALPLIIAGFLFEEIGEREVLPVPV